MESEIVMFLIEHQFFTLTLTLEGILRSSVKVFDLFMGITTVVLNIVFPDIFLFISKV